MFHLVRHRSWWMALALTLSPVPCARGETTLSQLDTCLGASGGVTAEILDCLLAANDDVEDELQDSLRSLRRELAAEDLAALDRSQDAWENFRRATCEFAAGAVSAGSFASVAYADCWLDITRQRLRWSQSMANGEATE